MSFSNVSPDVFLAFLVGVTAVAVVSLLYWLLVLPQRARPVRPPVQTVVTAFLFDGPDLCDATPPARQILGAIKGRPQTRATLGALLENQFPGLLSYLGQDIPRAGIIPAVGDNGGHVRVEPKGDLLRLFIESGAGDTDDKISPQAHLAVLHELSALRHIGSAAPQLIWKLDEQGTVTWANKAYLDLADKVRPPSPGLMADWPPIPLFNSLGGETLSPEHATSRRSLEVGQPAQKHWFDVTSALCDGGSIHFASSVDAIVDAEQQSKLFIQTLAKTFADLSTGLAIFDRTRRLVMFNPALMDLTRLPATFLTGRPIFSAVLDRLRNNGMLPEPKNYTSWRDQVAALEVEAQEGTYCETWTLPTGQTYRVTGRPHPNGALAFLIEDISDEVTLTRTFRSEIETAHAVIDAMEEAIAVFSPTGALLMSNRHYDKTWAQAANVIVGSNLDEEITHWKSVAAPTPFWQDVLALCRGGPERRALSQSILGRDGRRFECRVSPLVGGATLIGFSAVHSGEPVELTEFSKPRQTPDRQGAEAS